MKTKTVIVLSIIILAALNVYQYRNPKVVEVPAEQERIDETAWVKRSAYVDRGLLLDSIKAENQELSRRVRKTRDEIANLTTINGRLSLEIDSLQSIQVVELSDSAGGSLEAKFNPVNTDTSYKFIGVFGDGLFRVDSEVKLHPTFIRNELDLTQIRDIRISVVNTMNKDRSRMLTYVTSQDFEELEYQTYTELKQRKRWPWFLIGVGVGITGLAIVD